MRFSRSYSFSGRPSRGGANTTCVPVRQVNSSKSDCSDESYTVLSILRKRVILALLLNKAASIEVEARFARLVSTHLESSRMPFASSTVFCPLPQCLRLNTSIPRNFVRSLLASLQTCGRQRLRRTGYNKMKFRNRTTKMSRRTTGRVTPSVRRLETDSIDFIYEDGVRVIHDSDGNRVAIIRKKRFEPDNKYAKSLSKSEKNALMAPLVKTHAISSSCLRYQVSTEEYISLTANENRAASAEGGTNKANPSSTTSLYLERDKYLKIHPEFGSLKAVRSKHRITYRIGNFMQFDCTKVKKWEANDSKNRFSLSDRPQDYRMHLKNNNSKELGPPEILYEIEAELCSSALKAEFERLCRRKNNRFDALLHSFCFNIDSAQAYLNSLVPIRLPTLKEHIYRLKKAHGPNHHKIRHHYAERGPHTRQSKRYTKN